MNQYAMRRPQFWADPEKLTASGRASAKADHDLADEVREVPIP
jgi:hypothetical protein